MNNGHFAGPGFLKQVVIHHDRRKASPASLLEKRKIRDSQIGHDQDSEAFLGQGKDAIRIYAMPFFPSDEKHAVRVLST